MTKKALILAGGLGTRLWPLSRVLYPKQLLNLLGKKTLAQQTFLRIKKVIPVKDIYIVTSQNLAEDIFLQLKGCGLVKENIILEPAQKNTAPAIAFASKKIFELDKSAAILVCPVDHHIKPEKKFIKAVNTAFKEAENNSLVIFGVIPKNPSSEYGYLKIEPKGKNLKKPIFSPYHIYNIEKFIEKPNPEEAAEFIKEGYLWNSGMFVWKSSTILKEIKKYLPKVFQSLSSFGDYNSLDSISIDKGVLEFSKNVKAIPVDFQWNDIGSWKSLYQLLPKKSENKNVLTENAFELGCRNCLIQGNPKRVVGAIGLENVIIVDTEDAVLVSHVDKTHEVKSLLEKIKASNSNQFLQHPTVNRPWGYFTVLEEGTNFKIKKLIVKPGEALSMQYHQKRAEHWVVVKGSAKVKIDDDIRFLKAQQSIDIPVGSKHQLVNFGQEDLEIIEVQNGAYLGEDDIFRIKDRYERA